VGQGGGLYGEKDDTKEKQNFSAAERKPLVARLKKKEGGDIFEIYIRVIYRIASP